MESKFSPDKKISNLEISPAQVEQAVENFSNHFARNALRVIEEGRFLESAYQENQQISEIIKDTENKILDTSRNVTQTILQYIREMPFAKKIGLYSMIGFSFFLVSNDAHAGDDKIKNDSEKVLQASDYDLSQNSPSSSWENNDTIPLPITEKIKSLKSDLDYYETTIAYVEGKIKDEKNNLKLVKISNVSPDLKKEKIDHIKFNIEDKEKDIQYLLLLKKEIKENLNIFEGRDKEFFEEQREKLLEHVKSVAYLEKLQKEFGLSEEEAKKHQDTRIKNIKIATYSLKSSENIESDAGPGTGAYYTPGTTKVVIPYDASMRYIKESVVHELIHESTNAIEGMSQKAIDLMKESYNPSNFLNKEYPDLAKDDYFGYPEERIVRKQILDIEMEKLGIKKYCEPFTQIHYDKLMKLFKAGKLSQDAYEFMMTTKPEFEVFKKIFDELSFQNFKYKTSGDTATLEYFTT